MHEAHGNIVTSERMLNLDHAIEFHKNSAGCLIPILNESQKIFGCIPLDAQKRISEMLGIPLAEIYGVITFYSHFSVEPKGEHTIRVCMGTACYVKNAQRILEEVEKESGAQEGATSPDGKFTIDATRCIGACGLAPVMTVNADVYAHLSVDQVAAIIAKYKE
ncbi:MAG: NAD(P)H-dependent oxidoreductase subunit E [Spirochaetes bacterium]|nr:NAD(P)H-dependent oxidoreductase subunit E [Spirochaetota bacterium]